MVLVSILDFHFILPLSLASMASVKTITDGMMNRFLVTFVFASTFLDDAPSLKKADCGIAVEGASDAARSAAAVVFLDEGLSSIITSFKVARQIFHRMKAYIVYRIALCIHLEVYLVCSHPFLGILVITSSSVGNIRNANWLGFVLQLLSILILNETIRVDLIVFIAIFAEYA